MKNCFKCGLYWRGLTHDLSKYSWEEFSNGVKYYQGFRSPTAKERLERGYSIAWMHHKGRNKHHVEYWTDYSPNTKKYEPIEMPKQYLIESVCDRIAACKVYYKKDYKDDGPYNYFITKDETLVMHPNTRKQLCYLLTMLKEKGERETFAYIKHNFKKENFLKDI